MELSKSEKTIIENRIKAELNKRFFDYERLELSSNGDKLLIVFYGAKHTSYKSVKMLSSQSFIVDNVLMTKVHVHIRFLYNGRTSPIIGHNLVTIKIKLL